MDKKFESFLKIAKAFNSHQIVPTLYGSLGLYRVLDQTGEVNDIDIIIPAIYLSDKWDELIEIMAEAGYKQDSTFPHEFVNGGTRVGFESDADLYADINPENFNITQVDNVEFKELKAEEYLASYRKTVEVWEEKIEKYKEKIKTLEDLLR
ncbi:MAG: hypothetical protein Q7S53_02255 [bacterium]|nr:hypothetical protein [bacterium]